MKHNASLAQGVPKKSSRNKQSVKAQKQALVDTQTK